MNIDINLPGTYKITNKQNGKHYIGATTGSLNKRKGNHFGMLRRKSHTNKNMQSDYDEFGEGAFDFTPISNCSPDNIFEEENRLLEHSDWNLLYNISPVHRGGIDTQSFHHGIFLNPVGIEYEINNMEKFCREHGLNSRHMSEVRDGVCDHHKGWSIGDSGYEPFAFVSPGGILYSWIHGSQMEAFCKEHGLDPSMMSSVWHKRWKHHFGWRRYDTDVQWPCLVSPDTKLHRGVWNIAGFSRKHELYSPYISQLINGSRNRYKGWTLSEPLPIVESEIKVGYMK